MHRRLRESSLLRRLLPHFDLSVLRTLLPDWAIGPLRRLRGLGGPRQISGRLRLKTPSARREAAREELEALGERPLISLVMPTYKTELRYLREAIDSVIAQRYPEWELIVVDDGSGQPELDRAVRAYEAADPRVTFGPMSANGGISAATNAGMALAGGEFVGFLDHDDTLTPEALLRVAQAFDADPELDVVYTDSDKLTATNLRADPFLKPDWSPVYALGAMYIGHLLVVRRAVAEAAGGFDSSYDTIQDFEFMLRVSERTDRIHHIPEILYHWRAIPGSIAAGTDQKSGVPTLQARAVSEHLARRGVAAKAVPHPTIEHRAVLAADGAGASRPMVSVVIAAGRDGESLKRVLASYFGRSAYPNFETVVVRQGGAEAADDPRIVWVSDEGAGLNRARANNLGAAAAGGEYLLFLAAESEVVDPDWIELLLLHARLPGVAAVGPMVLRPDGRVEQAGVALGLRDPAAPMLAGFDADGDGYYGSMPCAREVSALSSTCMLVSHEAFAAVGGFDELYVSEYEDFDLCRRLARRGLKSVYAPRPRVVDRRSQASRRAMVDILDRALFVDNWYDDLKRGDPYFNPGFDRQRADYAPAGWRGQVSRIKVPLGMR
jgi:GT2 family glycosyltransferase